MRFASVIEMIYRAAMFAMPESVQHGRDLSAIPRNPTQVGRAGKMTIAQNRREAGKARNVRRNRLAHR